MNHRPVHRFLLQSMAPAALVLLLFAGSVFVQPQAPAPQPEWQFDVPPVRQGDAGAYGVILYDASHGEPRVVEAQRALAEFSWHAAAYVDRLGVQTTAAYAWTGIRAVPGLDTPPQDEQSWFIHSDPTMGAETELAAAHSGWLPRDLANAFLYDVGRLKWLNLEGDTLRQRAELRLGEDARAETWRAPLCGVTHPFQGATVDRDSRWILDSACYPWLIPTNVTLQPLEPGEYDGQRLLEWVDRVDEPSVRVWMSETSAYPVHWRITPDDADGQWDTADIVLSHFLAGTQAFPRDQSAQADTLEGERVPNQACCLGDFSGAHGFQLDRVWAAIDEAKSAVAIRDFLAEHPDAYASSITFQQTYNRGIAGWSWTITLGDEQERLRFAVRLPGGHEDVRTTWNMARITPAYEFGPIRSWTEDRVDDPAPPIPDTVPSMEFLLRRLEAQHGATLGDPSTYDWTFNAACKRGSGCELGTLTHGVRVTWHESIAEHATDGHGGAQRHAWVEVDEDGVPTSWGQISSESRVAMAHQAQETLPVYGSPSSSISSQTPTEMQTHAPWFSQPVPLAGVGAAAAALAWAGWILWKGAWWTGYTTHGQSKQWVLANPRRKRVFELIQSRPGIHYQELARTVQSTHGGLEHHLRVLLKHDFIAKETTAYLTCYYARGSVDRRVMAAVPSLKRDGAARVLGIVMARPGCSATHVANQLGVTTATVTYHLKRLRAAGIVAAKRGPAGLCLEPTELARQALEVCGRPGAK